MMKRIQLFFYAVLLSLLNSYAFLEKEVTLLTMQNGLSDNTVTCIYKDPDNYMWFGTNNGLNRYDGKTIRSFNNGASYMRVTEIKGIADPYLTVIADGKLYFFNRRTERFLPVYHALDHSPLYLLQVLPTSFSKFWGLSGNRMMSFQFHEVKNDQNEVMEIHLSILKEKVFFEEHAKEALSSFGYVAPLRELGLLTNQGRLLLISPQSLEEIKAVNLLDHPSDLQVTSVYTDEYSVWVTTILQGIIRYHIHSGKIERITYNNGPENKQLSHTDAFQIARISDEQYVAVTWSGYTILTCDKQTHEVFRTRFYKTLSSAYQNVETRMISVYYDKYGKFWIGTNGGGVIQVGLRTQLYRQFYQQEHNEICGIVIDDEQYIWLATFHEGIMKSTTPFTGRCDPQFTSTGPNYIRLKRTVLCAMKTSDGTLWFGNYDGTLTSYHPASQQFRNYKIFNKLKPIDCHIWALYQDSLQRIWVGTEKGLYIFEPKNGNSYRLPVEKSLHDKREVNLYVRAITSTSDGDIWLGTSNAGVCRIKMTINGSISAVRSGYEKNGNIDYWAVRSLLASSDGNLYVGYMDGFAALSPTADKIVDFYTTHSGLCSNHIGAIAEDEKGRIWLGSNSGISCYNRHQHLFYNYYIIGSNRCALSYNGILFWGNNRSLTFFNPDEFGVCGVDDKVRITALEVNNKLISINESVHGQVILQRGISYTDSLVLSNDNRDFSLSFNNLSYSNGQQKYSYHLLPYQKDWVISDKGDKAMYTNLPQGDYKFEVRSIFPDGQSGQITSLKIRILPHWSQTLLFRLLVIFSVLGMLAYIIRLVRKHQRRIEYEMQMKHELFSLNMEREKECQIRTEREKFFTSVAHELRTPLMLILSPLQELLQHIRPTDEFYNQLFLMYKNGTSLNTLVNHLLYVQKIDAGMVKLRLTEFNIISMVRDVAESFCPTAQVKDLQFDVELPESPLNLWIDTEKMIMAIRNLLSNAFKYTPKGGKVAVRVSQNIHDGKEFVEIVVSDTGIGIPVDLQEQVFDSFITGETHPTLSPRIGVGLYIVKNTIDLHHGHIHLESILEQGSTFTLILPMGKEHFKGDSCEFIDNQYIDAGISSEDTFDELSTFIKISSPVKEPEASTGSKKRILIIEDNEEVRLYIRSLFIRKYNVYEAINGEEGVRMAEELLPCLIISDIMMPVKDGITCCKEIRNLQKTAHIPILILTARAEESDVLQGYYSGVDEYVMKPFNPAILVAKVENLILQRERLKRIYTKALMIKEHAVNEEKENPFMQQVINVIELNLSNENFNVKILAEELGMSQPTLYRRMKQLSELAVVDIIRSVRISKAASLIVENCYSIQEVSVMVGYTDIRTLRKHFIEQFGVPPSKYLEKTKK